MAEKVTIMKIKADLQCPRCYKKIKRVLCRYPQIRDQVFEEKHNTVTITVVCCSPERIKEKISYRGGDTIKGIEIIPLPKPKAPEKKAPEPEKPKEKPKEVPAADPPKPQPTKAPEPAPVKVPAADPPKPQPTKAPEPAPVKVPATTQAQAPVMFPVPGYPPGYQIIGTPLPCYEGHAGGPSYHGYAPYGGPPPSSCYGRPVYDSWGGGGSGEYYGNRRDCFCEENPSACAIM